MHTSAPSANRPAPARGGVLRFLAGAPTAAVLAALGGAAYWGHATGWDFSRGGSPAIGPPASPGEPRPVVRLTPADPAADSPLEGVRARVEFATAAEVERAGIDVAPAWPAALTEQIAAAGEVQFDPARVARLPARAGGVTRRVTKAAGDAVRAGEVLALVDSPEVGKGKAELQQALVQARLRGKLRDGLVGAGPAASPAAVREAEASLKEAEVRAGAAAQTLTNLGLPAKPDDYRGLSAADAGERMRLLGVGDAAGLGSAGPSANLLPVRAPFAGVVLAADVVTGDVVEAGRTLFTVVDPARVWVTLHVAPEDARRVAAGQKAFFRPDGGVREHPAAVVWVGAAADEATRTVPVRAEADNAAGTLRASTLGRGRVVFREAPKALVVPHGAVHEFKGRPVVFVRDPDYFKPGGPKAFHARAVRPGGRDDRNTEILAGLVAGEVVATKGGGVLLGELLRATADR